MIALGGWDFSIQAVEIDEQPWSGEDPRQYVLRLAQGKAQAALEALGADAGADDCLLIAADTTVVDNGEILGKPADPAEARAMLERLRGRTHQVLTALAVVRLPTEELAQNAQAQPGHSQARPGDWRIESDLCVTDVPMRQYSAAELEHYIASGDPMDKAGAYAIQHRGFHPVESLQGCYANVVGLPLCHLLRTLRKLGVDSQADLPAACQASLEYNCPVYQQVLDGEI